MPAADPFPGIGFQITIQEIPTDDLPCYEQEQTGLKTRPDRLKLQAKVSVQLGNPSSRKRMIPLNSLMIG